MDNPNKLADEIRRAERPVFLTGAGISVASGIAPFRGTTDAVWETTVLEMGTRRMFRQDPARQWAWYLDKFDAYRTAAPNAGHHAITQMQRWRRAHGGDLRVITQNVDGLHTAADTLDVIEVHGSAHKIRCDQYQCRYGPPKNTLAWDDSLLAAFRADARLENLPRCPACDRVLRPHVLWFDEGYEEHLDYRSNEAQNLLWNADLLVFVGTSFSVGVTESAVIAAGMSRASTWSIDLEHKQPAGVAGWLREPAELVLPEVAALLM